MQHLSKWRLLKSQIVFNHQWYRLRQDQVELPNGTVIDDYFVSFRPDVALVLPITNQQEIVFVRQYRHGVGEVLLELPAGTFNPNEEEAPSAALRELEEETGYSSKALSPLGVLYDNPVKDTNKIHLFIAKDVQKLGEQTLDVTEEIEVILVPIQDAIEKVKKGEICVSGTIAAICLGIQFLQEINH